MSVKRSCFSLNVRGIRDLSKRKALFLFCMSQNIEIYFFQETHSSFKDETFWRNQWRGNILFCHGTNHSAGVLILFDRNLLALFFSPFLLLRADGLLLLFFWEISCLSWPMFMVLTIIRKTAVFFMIFLLKSLI